MLWLTALGLTPSSALALNFPDSMQYYFFQPGDTTRVGIEVQFKGITNQKLAETVARSVGGKIEKRAAVDIYDVELATGMLNETQVQDLQKSISGLKKVSTPEASLLGAVSTRINVEMAGGDRPSAQVKELLNILRNYFKPQHQTEIRDNLRIPVGEYSRGFMKRLHDPRYSPTWRELYDDFMYRQSLEVLGVRNAWTLPIEAARAKLLAISNPFVSEVLQPEGVRISSMLMWMNPEDPLTQALEKSKRAMARPVIEFPGRMNALDIVSPTRQALGLKNASARFGTFDHDTLMGQQLQMSSRELKDTRESLRRMSNFDHAHTAGQIAARAKIRTEDEALARLVDLNTGAPTRMGAALPESTYVTVKARKLKKAKVVWANREKLFQQYGIRIPPEGATPAQEKAMLDAWGWRIPHPSDPPGWYGTEERTFYSSRYGGDGLNGNFGGGRSIGSGESEIKGGGQTPNVSPAADSYYTKGGGPAYLDEGFREAVNAGASADLPYGANQVNCLIDPGDGTRALIIRDDDIRLGNITPRFHHDGDEHPANKPLHEAEAKRIRDIAEEQKVLDLLPVPDSEASSPPRKRFIAGIKELTRRYGEQTAAGYASGIFHGTTSASNQLVNGGVIDFGSQSYHPNHAPLQLLDDAAPGGLLEADEIIDSIVPDGAYHFAPPGRSGDKAALPSRDALVNIARKAYQSRLRQEFLVMTGLPEHLVATLKNTAKGRRLADTLLAIAEDSGGRMNIRHHTPTQMTRYNIRPIIQDLAAAASGSLDDIEGVLAKHMTERGGPRSEPGYWKQVAREYKAVMESAFASAAKDKIKKKAFFRLIQENSRYARERWELNHFSLEELSDRMTEEYRKSGDRKLIQRSMDEEIARNRLRHPGFKPYESVISVTEKDGNEIYRIFDAVNNQEALVMRTPILVDGRVHFAENSMDVRTALSARAEIASESEAALSKGLPATLSGKKVEYRIAFRKGHTASEKFKLVNLPLKGDCVRKALRTIAD